MTRVGYGEEGGESGYGKRMGGVWDWLVMDLRSLDEGFMSLLGGLG